MHLHHKLIQNQSKIDLSPTINDAPQKSEFRSYVDLAESGRSDLLTDGATETLSSRKGKCVLLKCLKAVRSLKAMEIWCCCW